MATVHSLYVVSILLILPHFFIAASAGRLAKPVTDHPLKPPPHLVRQPRTNVVRDAVDPSFTRLPNRPLPPPIPASPYVIINVSWPRPLNAVSISSPFSRSPHRAEYDTAITFPNGNEAFGAGCNATFSRPSSDLLFSGDDVYAPGWEAYRISISQLHGIAHSVKSSTSSEGSSIAKQTMYPVDKALFIYVSRQSDFETQFVIAVSAHSPNGNVISQTSLNMENAPTMTDICAVSTRPAASLRMCPDLECILLSNETDNVGASSEETSEPVEPSSIPLPPHLIDFPFPEESPLAATDPYPIPTVTPSPSHYSTGHFSTHALVRVSWSTPSSAITEETRWYTYASAGVKLVGESESLSYTTCSTTYPDDIVFMPHIDYDPTGHIYFFVNLDLLLDNSSVTASWFVREPCYTDVTIVTLADWYYRFNEYGSMSVSATLTTSEREQLAGKSSFAVVHNVEPGVSGSCAPKKEVARFVIRHHHHDGSYEILDPSLEMKLSSDSEPSTMVSPEVTELLIIDAIETPEETIASMEYSTFPEPEKTKFLPVLNSTSLLITTSWNIPASEMEMNEDSTYWELETGLAVQMRFGDDLTLDTCKYPARTGPLYTTTDDPSETGSESFLVDLNHLFDFPDVRVHNTKHGYDEIDVLVYASWYKKVNMFGHVTVSAKLLGPDGLPLKSRQLSTEVIGLSIGATEDCRPKDHIAKVTVQFNIVLETFQIGSLFDTSAVPMEIYETEPTASRYSKISFPPALKTTSILITTSWSTPSEYIAKNSAKVHHWDLETGISIPEFHGESFLFHTCYFSLINGPVYTTYNNVSARGSESFLVDLDFYASYHRFTGHSNRFDHFVIVIYADWFHHENRAGKTTTTVKLIGPGAQPLSGPGTSAELNGLSPGSTDKCKPHTAIASVTVRYDRKKRTFSIRSFDKRDPKESSTGHPHEYLRPPVVAGHVHDYAEETVEISIEATVEPSPRPVPLSYLNPPGDLYLAVTFTWPMDVIDLDSQVWLTSLVNGVGCDLDNTSTVLFGGDGTVGGGKETFRVIVGKAKREGRWVDLVDVTLAAYWFARDEYNDSVAEVHVDLVNEADDVIDSAQMTFSPYWHNRVQKPFCGTNKIGRVRVVDSDGTVSMQLGLY